MPRLPALRPPQSAGRERGASERGGCGAPRLPSAPPRHPLTQRPLRLPAASSQSLRLGPLDVGWIRESLIQAKQNSLPQLFAILPSLKHSKRWAPVASPLPLSQEV